MGLDTVLPSRPMGSCTHGARETMADWVMETLSANQNLSRCDCFLCVCVCVCVCVCNLVPRLHPAFQCWTLKSGRAWYVKSHVIHHSAVQNNECGRHKPQDFNVKVDRSKRALE